MQFYSALSCPEWKERKWKCLFRFTSFSLHLGCDIYFSTRMGRIRHNVLKFVHKFKKDILHDTTGSHEHSGTSRGEASHVDPQNWDLYWVSHTDDPPEEYPRAKPLRRDIPEPEFPREQAPKSSIDYPSQEKLDIVEKEPSHRTKTTNLEGRDNRDEIDVSESAASQSNSIAMQKEAELQKPIVMQEGANLRKPKATFSAIIGTETTASESLAGKTDAATETAADSPSQPSSLFSRTRSILDFRPEILKIAIGKLANFQGLMPSLKLLVVKFPTLVTSSQPLNKPVVPATPVKKKPDRIHYERTPLATYSRVKSRLQDRPPLVAAFADEVSVLSPYSLVPKKGFEEEVPNSLHPPKATKDVLQNLLDLLPTPFAALCAPEGPRKQSLTSILGGRAAKKVMAEIEHDPLNDSMIPRYQRWKRIKSRTLHNVQWLALITACVLLICAAHIPRLVQIKWWSFEFWQWLALGFVALAGRLLSGWGVKMMVILIEYNFLLKKRVLFFIFGLRRSVKNAIWLGFILLAWTIVTRHIEDNSGIIPTISKLLICSFTASTLWVTKVLLVKILANTFHRTAYFDRIQDSIFQEYVLETLSQPRSHKYARKHGGFGDDRREAAPVPKLRTAANSHNKLARREAKKQGRIERQYSPTPTESSLKRRFTRPQESAWQPYSDTARTLTSIADSLALKVPTIPEILLTMPSIFPYPSFLPPFSSSPSSAETQKPLSVSRTETPPGTFNLQHEVKDEEYLQDVESSVHLAALEEKDMGEDEVTHEILVEENIQLEQDTHSEQQVVPPNKEVVPREVTFENEAHTHEFVELEQDVIQSEMDLQEKQALPVDDASSGVSPPISSHDVNGPVTIPVLSEAPIPEPTEALTLVETSKPVNVQIFEMAEVELGDETGHKQQASLAQDKIQVLTKDSVSAWTLMRLMKVVRTRNLYMYSRSSLLKPDWEIDSIPAATAGAKHIFKNVAEPGKQEIVLKNFMKFFSADRATQAFSRFEVTVNGTITKQALFKWVLDVYKERKSLSLTLNDNRSVIYQVNLLLDGVLIAIIISISFLIMGFNNQALLACTSILLAPAVSIFGNLCRNTFESLLFLFVVHPFDVGDRVLIGGVPLMVEEMKIMTTSFLNNSSESVTYPNFILINKPIANIHRSPDQWDAVEFHILANTSLERISILRNRIDKYVQSLPQIWYPQWRLIVRDIENTNKLRLLMTTQHHINFQCRMRERGHNDEVIWYYIFKH
ncbi:uncharacterized protein [Physcomitrium patens]|uniref:uncharacterized protein isoform X3 n=1 Tax=Physcomitrium patens TaxID=3218 RepID=UPI003CCD6D10